MTANVNSRATARPQNNSCPAGGTTKGAQRPHSSTCQVENTLTQRGVIVAPPSGNTVATSASNYQVLHAGFDTIALSIRANISDELFARMDADKQKAEEQNAPLAVTYGGNGFDLLPHGGNGYRFILKGGSLGVHWFIKKPNPRDPWGIRISVGSTFLATQGLGVVRVYIERTLARLGIEFEADQVSIGRADFCIDVLAPNFELIPENFVIHSHTNRTDYSAANDDFKSCGKSGRFTSVTIGKTPGRQIIVYDKRREVIDRNKAIWWDIWNANLKQTENAPISPEDRSVNVFRIEIRAGKNLLKDRWNIRTWAEFDQFFGDVVAEALDRIRYCTPLAGDTNRARWPLHEIWKLAASVADADLSEMRTYLPPDQIKFVERNEQINLIFGQVLGGAITLAALEDTKNDTLPDWLGSLADRFANTVRAEPERYQNKLKAAANRYRFTE